MTNEKFLKDTLMDDGALDAVVGGAGHAYLTKLSNGKYDVVSASQKLNVDQVKGLLAGKAPAELGIGNNVIVQFNRGFDGDKIDLLKKNLARVYDGCQFYEIKP